jgi:hypothetical protein
VARKTTTQLIFRVIAKFKQQKKTMLALKPKLNPERSLWPSFSKKLMHSKLSTIEA